MAKGLFKKIAHFIFEDESFISWLVCLLLCFLIVLFVFFPFFRLLFSSSLPFVIVESQSMEHKGYAFDNWWNLSSVWYDEHNITKEEFEKWPMHNGFNIGDIIAVSKGNYKQGDIIIFDAGQEKPIIHRIVFINETAVSTKGDFNAYQLELDMNISRDKIIGRALFKVPKAGNVKLYTCKYCPFCCKAVDTIMGITTPK